MNFNEQWFNGANTHDDVEAAIKAKALELEASISSGASNIGQVAQAVAQLRAALDSLSLSVSDISYPDTTLNTLKKKLDAMDVAIAAAAQGGGGDLSNYYNKTEVDDALAEKADIDDVYDKDTADGKFVAKNGNKVLSDNNYTDADKTAVGTIPSKANDAEVVKSITVNGGTAQTPTQGNVNIVVPSGGLTESDISVETQGDGTVDINVATDTYTINLNHKHKNMAKIVKCTEATLPQTLFNDTIYVQVDNATTPTEIECLYLFGLEFTGGGLPAGVPQINKPPYNSTINLGTLFGQGGATGTVKIKGRSLTDNSTVVVSVGSGFSLSYGQQSGSSINIDAADVVLGCDVTVYATAYGTEGTMMIVSQTDNISVEVDLTSDVIEDLEGVKLTGSQWLDTDYHTNPQTKIVMDCLFEKNTITENQSYSGNRGQIVINCRDSSESALILQTGQPAEQIAKAYSMQVWLQRGYSASAYNNVYEHIFGSESALCNRSILTIDAPNKYISFQGVSWATDAKTNTQTNTLSVGRNQYSNTPFNQFDLTVYSLKLYDGAALVRDYSPKRINGVVGMLDAVSGGFMASGTQTPLEPVVSQS